jgi:hypothetical protein
MLRYTECVRSESGPDFVWSAMLRLTTILITFLLVVPAISIELFRYQGAAKDGGTLEYVFEAGEQHSPDAVTKEKAAEIADDFLSRTGRRTRNAGISDNARFILARLLFGHRPRDHSTNVLRRSAAGWDGC